MNPEKAAQLFLTQFKNRYGTDFYTALPNAARGKNKTDKDSKSEAFNRQMFVFIVDLMSQQLLSQEVATEAEAAKNVLRVFEPLVTKEGVKDHIGLGWKGDDKFSQVEQFKDFEQTVLDPIISKDQKWWSRGQKVTQTDEGSVRAESDLAAAIAKKNRDDRESRIRQEKGFSPEGDALPEGRTQERKTVDARAGFTDSGVPEGITPDEMARQLNEMYPPIKTSGGGTISGWTQNAPMAAPDGSAWLVITNNATAEKVVLDDFGGVLMSIVPEREQEKWDNAQKAIAARNADPNKIPVRTGDVQLDNDGTLFYWDPNQDAMMVQQKDGTFALGQPNVKPTATSTSQFSGGVLTDIEIDDRGVEHPIFYDTTTNSWKRGYPPAEPTDTSRFSGGFLTDVQQDKEGVSRPVWWDPTANNDAGGWKDGYAPEGRQQLTTYTTPYGEDVLINEEGTQVGSLGISRDFIVDQRDYQEGVRQFDVAEAGRDSRFYAGLGEDARQFDLGFGENVRQFDLGFGEDVRQFDTRFGEDVRQFDESMAADKYFNTLEELGRNYRTLVQTSPDLANAATQQGELIRNILTQGGDVLARTFFTRGGQSPLPEITMADLINNVYDEANKIKMFERQSIEDENMRRMVADMQQGKSAYDAYARDEMLKPPPQTRQDFFDETAFNTAMSNFDPNYSYTETAEQQAQRAQNDEIISTGQNLIGALQTALSTGQIASNTTGTTRAVTDLEVAPLQEEVRKQQAAVQEAIRSNAQIDSNYYTPVAPTREQFTTTTFTDAPRPIMNFENWWDQNKLGFNQTPLLNVPNVPTPNYTTQEELIAQSRATTPPAVQSLLSGQMPSPLQFGGLPLPTFQQLQALTPDEQQMFNQRLMTEFNVPLSDVAFQSQRQFSAPSMDRNRDLARFRGYSV